jgi:murein DD-endopeptidase MepM/ murein hydrolase activator NlpD
VSARSALPARSPAPVSSTSPPPSASPARRRRVPRSPVPTRAAHRTRLLATFTLGAALLGAPLAQGAGAPPVPAPAWSAPVEGQPIVLRGFLPPDQDWLAGHRGVDLEAPPGALVLAPADGVVTFAGTVVDRGVVVIRHADGLRSSLEPVDGARAVGTAVRRGETVGTVQGSSGAGHCLPVSCAHWGVRRGDVYVDPLALLAPREPIVLLPLR